jgi:hypothetical protein
MTRILVTGPQCVKMLDNHHLHPLPSAAVSAALLRGHAALAFMDVGVGFVDKASDVGAVGFLRTYGFLHIRVCITPEAISIFKTSTRNY